MNYDNTINGAIIIGFVLCVLIAEHLYNKWSRK